jgi:hypothetical protein
MLQQALASRRVAIDRGRLTPGGGRVAAVPVPTAGTTTSQPVTVISWPYRPPESKNQPVAVPSVEGSSVRDAAVALHRRGFRMSLRGMGRVVRTAPAAGEPAHPGASVTVWAE